MDEGHGLPRAERTRDMSIGSAVNLHAARIGGMDAAQDFDQGGFSRAIFAQQGHNLAPAHVQRHVAQGIGAAEVFFDPVKEQAICSCGWHASPSPVVRLALSVTFGQSAICARAESRFKLSIT